MAKNLRILNANKKNQSMRDLEYGLGLKFEKAPG